MTAIERDFVVAALEANLERIDRLTERLTPEAFDQRPADGRWSPHEIIEHLAVVERGTHKAITAATASPPSELRTLEKDTVIESYRDTPQLVTAPSYVQPTGRFGRDTMRVFRDRRITSINLARSLDVDWRAHHADHPLLGTLDVMQWFHFAAVHGDRHADQLERGE